MVETPIAGGPLRSTLPNIDTQCPRRRWTWGSCVQMGSVLSFSREASREQVAKLREVRQKLATKFQMSGSPDSVLAGTMSLEESALAPFSLPPAQTIKSAAAKRTFDVEHKASGAGSKRPRASNVEDRLESRSALAIESPPPLSTDYRRLSSLEPRSALAIESPPPLSTSGRTGAARTRAPACAG